MAAPTRNLFLAVTGNTATATFTPDLTTLQTGSTVGDVIVVAFALDGNPTVALNATSQTNGWSLDGQAADATVACKLAYASFEVVTAGTIPGLTISWTGNEAVSAQGFRIRPSASTKQLVRSAVTPSQGSSTNPDPPAVTNNSGSAQDIYYLTFWAGDGVTASTAAPTNYANHQSATISNAANGSSIGSADRTVTAVANATVEDPGVFTRATEQWVASTYQIYEISRPLPAWTSSTTASVAENTTLAYTMAASNATSYSIVGGADQTKFEVSGTTLRWTGNGTKDFEAPDDSDTNNTYVVTLRATGLGGTTDQTVTVTVTDVAVALNALGWTQSTTSGTLNFGYVNEKASAGTVVGIVGSATGSATAQRTAGSTLTIAASGNTGGGRFAINSTTGAVTVTSGATFDFETEPTILLDVVETYGDGSNSPRTTTLTIRVKDVFDGTASTLTWDSNDRRTSSIPTVNSATTVTGNSSFNSTAGIRANVGYSRTATPTAKIYVEGVFTLGTGGGGRFGFASSSHPNIAGNVYPSNPAVGATGFTWLNSGQTYYNGAQGTSYTTYTTGDTLMLALDVATGKVWIGKNGTWENSGNPAAGTGQIATLSNDDFYLYFGALRDDSITVNWGDSAYTYAAPSGFAAYNSGASAPAITNANNTSVAENATLSFPLTVSSGVPTWSIVGGADAADFAISGSTLTWVSNGTMDYETPADANVDNVYQVTVRATVAGVFTDQTINVTVTDVTELNNLTGSLSVAEGAATGTVVGTPAGYTAGSTKSLTDDAGGRFAINSSTGQVTVANGTLLNFEASTSHNITILETQAGSGSRSSTLSVSVTNVPVPVITNRLAYATVPYAPWNTTLSATTSTGVAAVTWSIAAQPAELLTNGDFSSGTGWNLSLNNSASAISGGTLNVTGGGSAWPAYQAVTLVAGKAYQVQFTITSYTSGSLAFMIWGGGQSVVGRFASSTGTFTTVIKAPSGAPTTVPYAGLISGGGGFVGSIDNFSVKEVPFNLVGSTLSLPPLPSRVSRSVQVTVTDSSGDQSTQTVTVNTIKARRRSRGY